MTWGQGSNIPTRVKAAVRRRDKTCQLVYPGCTGRIDEFDHIVGLADQGRTRAGANSATELQGVCTSCHHIKTKQQAAAGRARARQQRGNLSRAYRDREPHPGTRPTT